jgi:hypothetical protein
VPTSCRLSEASAAGAAALVNAAIFSDADLLGLGAAAEPVLRAHMRYPAFRGIRNSLHGCGTLILFR